MISYIIKQMWKDYKKINRESRDIIEFFIDLLIIFINGFLIYTTVGALNGFMLPLSVILLLLEWILLKFSIYIYILCRKYTEKENYKKIDKIKRRIKDGSEWKN